MKTAIKVLSILGLIGKIGSMFICFMMVGLLQANNADIIKMFVQEGASQADMQAAVGAVTAVYAVMGAFALIGAIINIVTLVKLNKLEKKPVGLGILSILTGTLITGICLLVYDPNTEMNR